MFRFEHREYLYLLALLPLLLALFLLYMRRKKKAIKRFGSMDFIRPLMPGLALRKQYLKCWLLLIAATLFILTVAGPQFGSKTESVKRQGIEVMVCLDVSNSMLSNDVKPSRLEKSKQILSRLIDELKNDKIGLIVFAGDAFVQLPITADFVSAKMFLQSINPSMVPTQGTAIGAAIQLAQTSSFSSNENVGKTIILITDGENHEGDAVSSAEEAVKSGIVVNVLGVGSTKGGPIPTANGYLKDREGNMILTRLDEKTAQEIALAGKGMYAQVDNTNEALKALLKQLKTMQQSDIETKIYSAYDEKYAIPAWILLVVLIAEFFILERKNRFFGRFKLFS
ncbi:MAG: VWA domain-containing protein [Candidatus Symbiothrix sp.]|jgi:Ca-activated chloride channel family protein|nr:VWA domain-containing protein [Candidatus Symbiothrix sp.]